MQGFVELSDTDTICEKQWLMIKDHLKLVFDKKTPDRNEYKNPNYDQILKALRPKPLYSDICKLADPLPAITC